MANIDSYKKVKDNKTLRYLFLFIFAIVTLALVYILQTYIWPFLISVILYLALRPFYDRVLKLIKNRSLSSMIVILVLFLVIFLPLFYWFFSLADQTYQVYVFIQKKVDAGLISEIQNHSITKKIFMYINFDYHEIIKKAAERAQEISGMLFSSITTILAYPLMFLVKFFFMLLMLFFLFKDGNNLGNVFYKILPFPDDIEKEVIEKLKEVLRVLLAGNILIMFLQGIFIGIGLYIIGNEMPIFWGSLAAILSLIPVVGTALIWVPSVLYLIFNGFYGYAIFFGIWSLFWYLFLENFIKPKVFGKRLNFHPLIFFFLILGSIQSFNIPGIILGPILLTLFYSLWEIYNLININDLK